MRLDYYSPQHKGDCLRIFDGNTPDFFPNDERQKFEQFLENQKPTSFSFIVVDERSSDCLRRLAKVGIT
jgi:hypothetical protein